MLSINMKLVGPTHFKFVPLQLFQIMFCTCERTLTYDWLVEDEKKLLCNIWTGWQSHSNLAVSVTWDSQTNTSGWQLEVGFRNRNCALLAIITSFSEPSRYRYTHYCIESRKPASDVLYQVRLHCASHDSRSRALYVQANFCLDIISSFRRTHGHFAKASKRIPLIAGFCKFCCLICFKIRTVAVVFRGPIK